MQPITKVLRAYHLTETLKLPALISLFTEKPYRASGNELVYRFDKDRYLIIYNFGSCVFFDIDPAREETLLGILKNYVSPKDNIVTSEEFFLEKGEKTAVDFRHVVLDKMTFERISIISLVVAQSAALDYFENLVNDLLRRSGEISEALEKKGTMNRRSKELAKFIGLCLNTKQKVISSTYILDDPDPTWEDSALEKLHRSMVDIFEIRERYRVLEHKLRTTQETLEILVDLGHSRRMLFLEIMIIVLIAVEVVLFVWQLFGGHTTGPELIR